MNKMIKKTMYLVTMWTEYPNGSMYSDGTYLFDTKKDVDRYVENEFIDRYGEDAIQLDENNLFGKYYYAMVNELGNRSVYSKRCINISVIPVLK